MGIRIIDDTTGVELPPNEAASFSASMSINIPGAGDVFARTLGPFFIARNGADNVLDNPQWQQIYALFLKMMPTVTQAWDAMAADIQRIIVTSAQVVTAEAVKE